MSDFEKLVLRLLAAILLTQFRAFVNQVDQINGPVRYQLNDLVRSVNGLADDVHAAIKES